MSDTLKHYVAFLAIPIGDTATLPHHLSVHGTPVAPDVVWLQSLQAFEWVASDIASVTIRNLSSITGDCLVMVEAWHPIERSFGLAPDDGTFKQHLNPQPFVLSPVVVPPPPPPIAFQMFGYTVLGTEPDLSEITITLPAPAADVNYGVVATCQGVAAIAGLDVHTKTNTDFVLSTTGDLQAGDVVMFFVSPLT